jgi:hypothetical protein
VRARLDEIVTGILIFVILFVSNGLFLCQIKIFQASVRRGGCRYSFCREEQGNISSGDLGQAECGVVVEDGGGDD